MTAIAAGMAMLAMAVTGITASVPPEGLKFTQKGKGSWFSHYRGRDNWTDPEDAPNSNSLGILDAFQGIALPSRATLGQWFMVKAPNGYISVEMQTDVGPARRTGRKIDISAAAAERFGYSPADFPTDGVFEWKPIPPPVEVAEFGLRAQASKFYAMRTGTTEVAQE